MRPMPEVRGIDRPSFDSAGLGRHHPVVLRGLVADWPLVRLAAQGTAPLASALQARATDHPVDAVLLTPQQRGRIFYGEGFQGFNYLRKPVTLHEALEQVQRYARFDPAPAVAVQSAAVADCLPGFTDDHPMPLLDATVAPRLWLGTAITTPAHFDESANIACVVAGRRRFTVFAPEQVGNLYIGPIGHAPTGTPISLVDFDAPDLERHPRFAQALEQAWWAELVPGDAICIPPLWWHHVRSLSPLNLLINYWWKPAPDIPSAMPALLHAMLALGSLPAEQRRGWQQLFAHWVFEADAGSTAHLPPPLLGVHGPWTPALREQVRAWLAAQLGA